MSRKMLINVLHPEEARVAIVQEGLLMELNIEISGKEQTKGNIYKGVVVRVEPGLQAAFVDIGQKKPGFIQMGDLHPDSWQWREGLPEEERKRRPRIQDVLRRGQELIVQVEKDARDMKGCALTSYLSLPGRYMVLMPGDTAAGISRKIEDNAIRKELKSLVAELQVPEGYGYIVRTEAVGRTQEELKKDLEYLIGVYERIRQHAATIKGAGEVYQDAGVILRTIRDYFSDDIDEVLVDDKAAFHQAVEFFKEIMPGCEGRVKLHREKRPIFSKYQLEEQIDQLYEKRVPLPSGGSLVIEPTEALVSIDVNSGKSSGERGVEDTAFKTNMEAAAEVARQLRLRDLGGLVVIDFIDMRDNKHNKEVEHTLKDALKADKARMNLGRISQFGMMEMSRQRIAKNINDAIHLECPHCEGRGRVKSVEAMALSFLRKVHGAAAKGQISEVRGGLPLEVAYFLLNRKKRELAQIENDYEIVVTIKGKPSFLLNQLELEVIRKEKVRDEIVEANQALLQDAEEIDAEPVADTLDGTLALEGSAKKRRKRKRKKKSVDRPADALITELIVNEAGESDAVPSATEPPMGDSELSGEKEPVLKKRRRSRARKKSSVSPDGVQLVPSQEDVVDLPSEEKMQPDTKPTRSPRSRRTKQVASVAVHPEEGQTAVDEVTLQSAPEVVTELVTKKRSPPRQKKVQQELTEKPSETVSNDVESKPRKRITSRSKKVAVVPDAGREE
jgi:ribonuclease E